MFAEILDSGLNLTRPLNARFARRLIAGAAAIAFACCDSAYGSFSYTVDFDSVTDLSTDFVEVAHNFNGIYSNGSALWFDRPGAQSQWAPWNGNVYAFKGAENAEPMRFTQASATVKQYINYPASYRGVIIGTEFYLFDPNVPNGSLGSIADPFVRSLFLHAEWNGYEYRTLSVIDGILGYQNGNASWSLYSNEATWTTVGLSFAPSAGGGYDIVQSVEGGKGVTEFKDHTTRDLSNVALGMGIVYAEFMDGLGYTAYVDDFVINAAESSPVPSPSVAWLLLAGIPGLRKQILRRSRERSVTWLRGCHRREPRRQRGSTYLIRTAA